MKRDTNHLLHSEISLNGKKTDVIWSSGPCTMAHSNGQIKLGWHGQGLAFFPVNRQGWMCLHSAHCQAAHASTASQIKNVPIMQWAIYTFMLPQLIKEVSKGQGSNLRGARMIQWESRSKRKGGRKRRVVERQSWPWLNQLSFFLLIVIIFLLFNQCLLVLWGCCNDWHLGAITDMPPALFSSIRCRTDLEIQNQTILAQTVHYIYLFSKQQ